MDKHGQIGLGFIVIAAITILIGLAFYTTTFSENIGTMTKTRTATNVTMTLPAVTATSEMTMCGQKVVSSVITNATGGAIIPASNYTISQSSGTDGYLASKITTASQSAYAGRSINISCNYEPKGYIAEGSGRAVVILIAIMMALLIVVAAMPDVKDKMLDLIHR